MATSFNEMLKPFKHRDFTLFFFSNALSLLGMWMQSIAISWLVYEITGSALLLGTTILFTQLPSFCLTLFGGIIADKYDVRKVIIFTQFTSMICAFGMCISIFTDTINMPIVFLYSFVSGTIMAIEAPCRQSFIIKLVGREDLKSAIAMNASLFNSARMIGPMIGGLLIPLIGEAWLFAINSITFIAPIICLFVMKVEHQPNTVSNKSMFGSIAESVIYVYKNKLIFNLLLMLGLFGVVHISYNVLFPIIAVEILHGDSSTLGLLTGSIGFGAIFGSLYIASQDSSAKYLVYYSLGSSLIATIAVLLFAEVTSLTATCGLLVVLGFTFACQMSATNTSIQLKTKDEFRGRVMALYNMMFIGLTPIGSIGAGYLADKFNTQLTITFFGIGGIVLCAIFFPILLKLNKNE